MKSNFIAMLTYNDKTVKNAIEVFDKCKDSPVKYWGFKDVGLSTEKMKKLISDIRKANKKSCLEVVSYTEESCMKAAKLAVECEFDYLMGTIFYENVYNYIKDKPIKFVPFCGEVTGSPSVLKGEVNEIVKEAKELEKHGVDGLDILSYRYVGNPLELTKKIINEVNIPVVMAGSIGSFDRLDEVKKIDPWGFTIGSALFDKKFVKDGDFNDQLIKVVNYLEE